MRYKLKNNIYLERRFKPIEQGGDGVIHYYIIKAKNSKDEGIIADEVSPVYALKLVKEQQNEH